jgi:TonB family protein
MLLPRITTIFLLHLALSTVVLLAGSFGDTTQTKDPKPNPTPAEKSEKDEPLEDKIYSAKEVDVKAKVIGLVDDLPKVGADCPEPMRLAVTVTAVLRKSGKVTETELVKESGCRSYDQDAIRAVSKLRFNPALKDNQPVSQYQVFEFRYSRF